jgi:hypothetical protein
VLDVRIMLGKLLEAKEKPRLFQVLFLKNDGSEGVEAEEVEELNFTSIKDHLERGESIFITNKSAQTKITVQPKKKTSVNLINKKRKENSTKTKREKWYFDHI